MTQRLRQLTRVASVVGGLLVVGVLWIPYDSWALSFSGPSHESTHYGLLNCVEVVTQYDARRHPPAVAPPILKACEFVWDHRGTFGDDVVIARVREQTVSVHYPALAASIVLTVLVLWFAVLRPCRCMLRAVRTPASPPEAVGGGERT